METIALFGGSFDPPHIAHETIVRQALKIKDVDKVLVMPTFLNPFKSSFYAPASLRLEWLQKIFKSFENVEVSDFEVQQEKKVSSIDTVNHLLKKYKKIYLIIGADNLKTLREWKNFNLLKNLVTFVVATRETIKIPDNFIQLKVKEDISSTILRTNIDREKLSNICANEIINFYKEKNER